MKKTVSLMLSVALVLLILPINVFATGGNTIVGISIEDTYVYDGTQEDNGKFEKFSVKIITAFEDGSTHEEDRIAYRDGVETNWGTLYISDNQDTELWKVGNTYQVTGNIGNFTDTFNVEVREKPITEISIDDFCIIKSDEYFSEESGDVYNIYNLMGDYRPYYVTYKDGSNGSVYGSFSTGIYTSVTPLTTCAVPYEEWQVGNTYEVTATLLGISDTFNVTLLELESISVDDIERIQNYDGYMDGIWNENFNDYAWFRYHIYPDNIVLTFTNGTNITGTYYDIRDYIGLYLDCYSDQSYENQWGLGNHTATITICGQRYDYTVKVVESPIKNIIVDDVTYIEGTNGWTKNNDDNQSWYYYDINPETLTVFLKDGSEISGTLNEVCEQLGCWQNCTSNQSYDNSWGVGEHVATIDLLGFTAGYKIIITESPIQSLVISDVSFIEYSNGYYAEDYDEHGQPLQFYRYYCDPSFIVTLKNGEQIESNGSGIYINGEYYWLSVNDNQGYNNQWTVGNTYEVTGSLMGSSDTFTVTITESPIESIEINDISIVEYSNGWQEDGFFYYCNFYPKFSVTMKNGETFSGNGNNIEINGEWYPLNIDAFIQYNEHWAAGNTYTVSGSVLGVKDTFNVTITESPIKSIEIDDVTVDVFDGYYSHPNYRYGYNPHFTITLNDGRTIESDRSYIQIDGVDYWLSLNDNQYENPWMPGNSYELTGTLMGKSDTFTVTVSSDNPIKSVEIEDITVYEGIDGYYDIFVGGEEFFRYDFQPKFKIIMKDGRSYYSDNYSITIGEEKYYEGIYFPEWYNQSPENHFETGKTYELTGYIFGVSDTFSVTVKENPIKKIAIKKYPKNEYLEGERFDLYGAQLRISYKDGTYEDVDITTHSMEYGNEIFLNRFGKWFSISDCIDYDEEIAKIEFLGKTATMDVFISPNLTEMITLGENEYKQPVITVYNSDATSYDMTVNYMQAYDWGEDKNILYYQKGILYTDKGNFHYIYEEDANGNCRFGLQKPNSDGYVYTNRIPKLKWMQIEKNIKYDSEMITWIFSKQKFYNGIITKDNIDEIIEFALYRSECYEYRIKGNIVKQAVYDVFGEKIDLNLSNQYDSQTDVYILDGNGGVEEIVPNFEIKYINGIWEANLTYRGLENHYETIYYEYDDNLKIKAFSIGEKLNTLIGDGNGDGKVDAEDLIILRKSLLTDSEYSEVLDANGDGVVDIRDLVRMKKHLANGTPLGKQENNTQQEPLVTEIANIPGNKEIA